MPWRKLILALVIWYSISTFAQPLLKLGEQDDRIVLIGNGLIEQERVTGYLETRLMRHALNRSITCRDLGWSGDSVSGDARPAGFQNPSGVDRLVKDAQELKPTVIFVGYGFVESFEGTQGLERFIEGYNHLLDRLEKLTPTLVLVSPTIQEGNAQRDKDLEQYVAAVHDIAGERKLPFVDLFHPLMEFKRVHPDVELTSNGITLNACGYWIAGDETERQLHLDAGPWRMQIEANGNVVTNEQAVVTESGADKPLKIQLTEIDLPIAACPCGSVPSETSGTLQVANLAPGKWTLKSDGQEVLTADAAKWAAGTVIPIKSDRALSEHIRQAVIDCEELFYRRSRPFNDHPRHYTYIDKDYPLYDAQLAEQDKMIAAMRHPVVHELELIHKETAKP